MVSKRGKTQKDTKPLPPRQKTKPRIKTVIVDERKQPSTREEKFPLYKASDVILPDLTLEKPCPITISVTKNTVILQVGPRDWQWSRQTGELVGAGTAMFEAHAVVEGDPIPVEGVLESDTEEFDEEEDEDLSPLDKEDVSGKE